MANKEKDNNAGAECRCNPGKETHHSVLREMPHKEERREGKKNEVESPARIFNREERSEEIPDLSKDEGDDIEPGESSSHCISRQAEENVRIPETETFSVLFHIGDQTLACKNITGLKSLPAKIHRVEEDEEKNHYY